MNSIKFEELNYKFLLDNNKDEIKIIKEDLDFYFKLNIKPDTKYLIAFSNGAINPQKNISPIYMRSKWADDFNSSCIFIDDRTIHNLPINIGWGIGTPERHYLVDYSEIVMKISSLLKYNDEKVIYYGSSAGGFISIALASYHIGSIAIANNPQTYINNYLPVHVEKMYKSIFPGMDKKEILKNYGHRFSLLNMMTRNKNIPRTIYMQNRLCKSDMKMHYTPFFNNADKFNVNLEKINTIVYNNKLSGHNPVGREKTINFINNLIETDFNTLL